MRYICETDMVFFIGLDKYYAGIWYESPHKISKKTDAQIIQKFRPVSLIDCCYKIISKILTNRLVKFMNKLVDPAQATFIQYIYIYIYILDNVLTANEIIRFAKNHKQQGIALKIDFEKIYDRVSWTFLKELLLSRRFDLVWTTWIEMLLVGAQTYINFNGHLIPYFACQRGLKQG
jgi:Reverse transcriptase (RNA-dependent DNA polymerase)